MQLQLRTFDQIVSSAAAAVQGAAQQALDLSVGSVMRAVLEANAGLGLWMQWLILEVLQTTRAATSSASDLDSWVADFGLARIGAVAASGQVTFARLAPAATGLVPSGTVVRTTDGSQSFAVTSDGTNPSWNAAQNGYLMQPGIASVTVPVAAQTSGSAGNVQANTVGLIVAALPGVDTVTNAAPIVGGLDSETDDALRRRFASYIASRSRATTAAIGFAVTSVQQNLTYTIQENVTPGGSVQPGCFVVTVDDGSGVPSSSLLGQVSGAIEEMRPLGSIWAVMPPNALTASISLTLVTTDASTHAAAVAAVSAALQAYTNSLPVGATLPWSKLAQLAYEASPNVVNLYGLTINGSDADLVPGPGGVVKAGAITVF